jgi:RHS repeat-associated protein
VVITGAGGQSVQYLYDGGSVEGYRANYEQTFSYDIIGNLTRKTSRENKTQQVRNGMELNYDFDYEYYENSHRAERIGDMYYRYDGNGNVVEERYGGHSAADAAGVGYRYEDGIYSTDYGFALTRPNSGSGGNDGVYERRYTWDYRNQLLRTKDSQWTVNYRYGHDGQRRVKYTEETRNETLYFNNMWQTSTSGNGSEWLQSKHIFVGESRIATKSNKEIAGKTEGNLSFEMEHQYWYHSDHLGSAQLTTSRSGELHERIEYTPYGEIWVEHKYDLAEGSLPYRFMGKELDEETGYYYGARYLDPRTSRWISTDPAVGDYVPSAPVDDEAKKRNGNLPGMGGVFNVVNLHVYHYAGNNPVKLVDPNGRENKVALKFMQDNMKGIPFGPGYQQRPDGTWPLIRTGVKNLPKELFCYEAVYFAYINSGVSWGMDDNDLPSARSPAFTWFDKGGTVDVNGKVFNRKLETDIAKGQVGDIVFMGEHSPMDGHSALLEKIEKIDANTIILTAFGAAEPRTKTIESEKHRFEKNERGEWRNKSHGNSDYVFRGYGQLYEN